MRTKTKKWVWQHEDYPRFPYQKEELVEIIAQIEYNRGLLEGVSKLFGKEDIDAARMDALVEEAIHTSLIEGEHLRRESVRSSVRKKLDVTFRYAEDDSTRRSDALVEVLIDCNTNGEPVSVERLHGWHNAFFVEGYDVLNPIRVAAFRTTDDMEVVSGPIGQERVHYRAVPQDRIEEDITALLAWCNTSRENAYIKSALAHLWFVIIHPYDDGNGRIARALTDYLLSRISPSSAKLYSISQAINHDRKGYYAILEQTTNLIRNRQYDFTPWLKWHLQTVNHAMTTALEVIEETIQKTRFWDRCRDKPLNDRQRKVLKKIFEHGGTKFEGGIHTRKYISIAKTSRATAVRDLNQLVEYGCIRRIEGSAGRSVRYEVVVDDRGG